MHCLEEQERGAGPENMMNKLLIIASKIDMKFCESFVVEVQGLPNRKKVSIAVVILKFREKSM